MEVAQHSNAFELKTLCMFSKAGENYLRVLFSFFENVNKKVDTYIFQTVTIKYYIFIFGLISRILYNYKTK